MPLTFDQRVFMKENIAKYGKTWISRKDSVDGGADE